jgi:hypothetical protein
VLVAAILLAGVAVIGPWPVWDRPPQDSEYSRATLRAFESSPVFSGPIGPLRAGFGSSDLPLPEKPSGSWPRHNLFATLGPGGQGAEPLRAYALAISDGTHTLSLVSVDLLLITPAIADATLAGLREMGPPVERAWIYFGATHTHSGSGGLGDGFLEQVVMGRYQHEFVRETGRRMAAAIRQAGRRLTPAEVGHAAVSVPEPLGNRLAPGGSIDTNLDILVAREPGGRPLATLLAYAAHATTLGGEPRGPSADYPGALARRLRERTGAPVFFLAGAVGSMTVVRDDLRGPDGSDRLGAMLADAAARALPEIPYRREGRLASLRFPVYLPTPQIRLARGLALSPVLPWLFLPRMASLQAVAINDLVMVGVPGEYSGEESLAVREAGRARGLHTLVTSLNGEYVGYIVPDARYWTENYETRWGTTYGPHLGSYFHTVIGAAVARLASPPTAAR